MMDRIAQLEIALAEEQTSGAICQLDAKLVHKKLRDILDIADRSVARLSAAFDDSVKDMARDLNGHGDG